METILLAFGLLLKSAKRLKKISAIVMSPHPLPAVEGFRRVHGREGLRISREYLPEYSTDMAEALNREDMVTIEEMAVSHMSLPNLARWKRCLAEIGRVEICLRRNAAGGSPYVVSLR